MHSGSPCQNCELTIEQLISRAVRTLPVPGVTVKAGRSWPLAHACSCHFCRTLLFDPAAKKLDMWTAMLLIMQGQPGRRQISWVMPRHSIAELGGFCLITPNFAGVAGCTQPMPVMSRQSLAGRAVCLVVFLFRTKQAPT